jgi:hypothetical protein
VREPALEVGGHGQAHAAADRARLERELDGPVEPVGLVGRLVVAHDRVVDQAPAHQPGMQRPGHHLQRVLDRPGVEPQQPGCEQDQRTGRVLDELVAADRQAAAGQAAGELAVGGAGRGGRPGVEQAQRVSHSATQPFSLMRARWLSPAAP